MNKIKKYILLTLSMLMAALLGAIIVWYFLVLTPIKDAQNRVDSAYQKALETGSEFLDSAEEKIENTEVGIDSMKESDTVAGENMAETEQLIIKKSNLPEAQQSILTTFGFGENITITTEMRVCAEVKLGTTRLTEIVEGASPSFLEATSLVTCLKK